MEGVLVSAKKQGSTITVTVVSDAKGEYAFPASRLEPGAYRLTVRASGYALDGSGRGRACRRQARDGGSQAQARARWNSSN